MADTLNIGANIAARRKQKGLTQEELAVFLKVSVPAVSKWETGQSYPDITLLPVIAGFFDLSVDELIGYQPQADKAEIRAIYRQLQARFDTGDFNAALEELHQIERKYCSCWPLQMQLGALLVNQIQPTAHPEQTDALLHAGLKIFERIRQESPDLSLAHQAVFMQASCLLLQNQADAVIELLEGLNETQGARPELLLAQAYMLKGELNQARQLSQRHLLHMVSAMIQSCSALAAFYPEDPARSERLLQIALDVTDRFNLDATTPFSSVPLLLGLAQLYAAQGDKESALDYLEKYVRRAIMPETWEPKLQAHDIFDELQPWFDELALGAQAPRSHQVIASSLAEMVSANPAFTVLQGDPRFEAALAALQAAQL